MADSRKFVAKTKDVSLTVRRTESFLVLVMLIVRKKSMDIREERNGYYGKKEEKNKEKISG